MKPRKSATNRDRLHSVESAAEFLGGVAPSTIRVWIWRGLLTRIKVGRRTMVRESELLALIKPDRSRRDKPNDSAATD
jgi:hypothetical protein